MKTNPLPWTIKTSQEIQQELGMEISKSSWVDIKDAENLTVLTVYNGDKVLADHICYIVNTHDKLISAMKKILLSRCEMEAIAAAVVADELEGL